MQPLDVPGIDSSSRTAQLMVLSVIFALSYLLVVGVRRSGFGQRLLAMKDSPAACATLGLDITRLKLAVFALSAAMAGVGGALYAGTLGSVGYERFNLFESLPLLLLAVVGGHRHGVGRAVRGPDPRRVPDRGRRVALPGEPEPDPARHDGHRHGPQPERSGARHLGSVPLAQPGARDVARSRGVASGRVVAGGLRRPVRMGSAVRRRHRPGRVAAGRGAGRRSPDERRGRDGRRRGPARVGRDRPPAHRRRGPRDRSRAGARRGARRDARPRGHGGRPFASAGGWRSTTST